MREHHGQPFDELQIAEESNEIDQINEELTRVFQFTEEDMLQSVECDDKPQV